MKYKQIWDKVLLTDEKIEHEFSIGQDYSKIGLIVWGIISFFLWFAMGLGILTFLIALFYYQYYIKVANAYAFTNKRIIIHIGWLSTCMKSVEYGKITDIHVEEPFLDKIIMHTGNLAINTAGSANLEIVLKHIEKPYELKKRLDEIMQKVK